MHRFIIVLILLTLSKPIFSTDDDNCNTRSRGLSEQFESAGRTTERLIWGKWDCPYCKTKGISARPNAGDKVPKCSFCGKDRDKNIPVYLGLEVDDSGRAIGAEPHLVRTESEKKIAEGGVNWSCSFCGASNYKIESKCEQCGAGKPCSNTESRTNSVPYASIPRDIEKVSSSKISAIGKIAAAVAFAGSAIYGAVWMFTEDEYIGQVSAMNWIHHIVKETFKLKTLRDWKDNIKEQRPIIPVNGSGEINGAFNLRNCNEEFHHKEKDECGSHKEKKKEKKEIDDPPVCKDDCRMRDNGNGSFKEKCVRKCTPQSHTITVEKEITVIDYCERSINKIKCDYDTYNWVITEEKQTSGTNPKQGTKNLPWPEMDIGELDKFDKTAYYSIIVSYKDGDKTKSISINEKNDDKFLSWNIGDRVKLFIHKMGELSRYERLQ